MKSAVSFLSSLAILALLDAAGIRDWMISLSQWSSQQGVLGIFVFVAAFTVVTVLCIPVMPLTLAGGAVFGPVLGSVAVLSGIGFGAAVPFLLARYVARAPLERRLHANPRFAMIDTAIGLEGWKIVGLLRMCPIPFGLSNYAYGLTSITFWHYIASTLVGVFPGIVMYVYVGALGMDSLKAMADGKAGQQGAMQYVLMGMMLVAGVAALGIVGRIVKRAIQAKIGEAEAA